MNELAEDKILKEEIEQMRQQLYAFIDAEFPSERIVSFSQELDLLINKYNKWEKYGGWNSSTSTIFFSDHDYKFGNLHRYLKII